MKTDSEFDIDELDSLEKIAQELYIDDSYFMRNDRGYDGYIYICYDVGVSVGGYMGTERGEKLVKLLEALPRLINMAQAKLAGDYNQDE